jgi:hypothetical protein
MVDQALAPKHYLPIYERSFAQDVPLIWVQVLGLDPYAIMILGKPLSKKCLRCHAGKLLGLCGEVAVKLIQRWKPFRVLERITLAHRRGANRWS